jgi:hypothetical protein
MYLPDIMQHAHNFASARLFLQNRHILRSIPPNCPICNRVMTEVKTTDRSDEVIYRCPSHKAKKMGIRFGSFLANSHLSLQEFILLTYFWSHSMPNITVQEMFGFSNKTICDWYNFLRNVCSHYLEVNPIRIGGIGHTVEIDESVISRRKYNVGHIIPQKWIFGGIDNITTLINEYILPGSEIHSDGWQSYNGIVDVNVNPPYTHKVVNHNENFVDPVTGATTNHIERMWKSAKRKLKHMSGTSDELLPSYLHEFSWRQIRGKTGNQALRP